MDKKLKKQRISNKNTEGFKNKYLKNSFLKSIFSKLSLKNITIIRSFKAICFISILTTFIIGISSFVTINATHNNLKLMYTSCLQRDILLSSINMHLNDLRNDIPSQIENPKESYRNNINKAIEGISTDLTQYKSLEFTDGNDETNELIDQLFITLKDNCNDITKIKNNDMISTYTKNLNKTNFEKNDYNFSDVISSAVTKNKADAEQLFNQTDNDYVKGIITLIVFFIISIILILLIATMVIKLLKKSISSFNSILDTLAIGDFTVKIESDEKSEIGLMKKELATTINSISYILKLIKDGSLLTLEKSKSLASVSKEMDCTMQEVAVAIHGIADGCFSSIK